MPKKDWRLLNQKQKARIQNRIYKKVFYFYWKHGRMPDEKEAEEACQEAYDVISSMGILISYETFQGLFCKKLPHFAERIPREISQGITWDKLNTKKSKEKKQKTNRRPRSKKKEKQSEMELDQDENFFFIAGYTSGGFPYGLTWEEAEAEGLEEMNLDDLPFS